jgi:hypothetical protein
MRTVSSLSNNNEWHYSKSTYCVINSRVYEKGLSQVSHSPAFQATAHDDAHGAFMTLPA